MLLSMMAMVADSRAADWPQWRGPLLNGSTPETVLPARWSKTEKVLWRAPLPGSSGATPVVWGNSVFVSSPDQDKNLWFFCLDARNGEVKWRAQVGSGNRTQGKNNLASPSAVTDGQRVICLLGTGDLAAFDFSGRKIWGRDLSSEFGRFAFMFLYGSSPLLWENRLYVQVIQRNPPTYSYVRDDKPERDSYLLCLDPATGSTLWRHVRKTDARGESMECYTTPLPYPEFNPTHVLVVGANAITAHDPQTGKEAWTYPGVNLKKRSDGRIVPSAVVVSNLIYACGPKRELLVAFRGGPSGTLGEECVAWKSTDDIPDVCTPLVYQGRLYVLDGDQQILTCYEPVTGRKIWRGKLDVREIFSASPTGADGKIYLLSEDGTAVVLSAGDRFEVLDRIPMGERPCYSSIAVAGRRLYIRTAAALYCLGESQP